MYIRKKWKSLGRAFGQSVLLFALWMATLAVAGTLFEHPFPNGVKLALVSLSTSGILLIAPFLWRYVDRRPLRELFAVASSPLRAWLTGGALGGGLLVLSAGFIYMLGGFSVVGLTDRPFAALVSLLFFVVPALSEEVAFRGYLFPVWRRAVGTSWAIIVTSLLFSLVHSANDEMTWVAYVNIYLAGVLMAIVRLRCDLWAATAFHLVWNAAQCFAGFNVSGNALPGFFVLRPEGEWWISGRGFGVEGSVCTAVLLGVAAAWLSLRPRRDCRMIS